MASDVTFGNKYLSPESIKSQEYIKKIEDWTEAKQMKLNVEKSKYMVINFTKKYQVNSRIYMQNELLKQVTQTRLLGVILREDLSFKANTENITRNAYKRMSILHKLTPFCLSVEDMVNIYVLYIRSVLEQSSVVWNGSITKGEQMDIERVQKF